MTIDPFLRRRPKVWVPALLVLVLPAIMLARVSDTGRSGIGIAPLIVMTLATILLVFLLLQIARMFAGVDPEVPALAEHLTPDPTSQRLLSRWMVRARRARNIGGTCGVIVWMLGTSMGGDLLLCGVGGIALGAMAAELHQVRPPKGPRTATLDVRRVDAYLMTADRNRMIGVALAAVGVAATGLAIDGLAVAWWCGIAALVVIGLAHVVQRRVASRPRQAVGESLRRADDLARELAIGRGLARPATYFGLAVLARGAFSLGPDTAGLGTMLGVVAWVYALVLWWNNRRLGLDFLLDGKEPVLA